MDLPPFPVISRVVPAPTSTMCAFSRLGLRHHESLFYWTGLTGKVYRKPLNIHVLVKTYSIKLVGGLEHEFYFSICWEFHDPNWLSYFSEGLKTPTRKTCKNHGFRLPMKRWRFPLHQPIGWMPKISTRIVLVKLCGPINWWAWCLPCSHLTL